MNAKLFPATVATIAALAVFSPSVLAADYIGDGSDLPRQTVVSYYDLDVSREPGARALLNRIDSAADRVCGSQPYILDLKAREIYLSCVDETTHQAVADADVPLVTALQDARERRYGTVIVEPAEPYSPSDNEPPDDY